MSTAIAYAALLSVTALAQETFRVDAKEVLIPVTVTGKDKKFLEGLEPGDFTVLDGGKLKRPRVEPMDAANVRVAIVVAVQLNDIAAPALAKIRKTGSLIQPLVIGDAGLEGVITIDNLAELLEIAQSLGRSGAVRLRG